MFLVGYKLGRYEGDKDMIEDGFISYHCPYPLHLDCLDFTKNTLEVIHNCKRIIIPFDLYNRIGKINGLLFKFNFADDKRKSLPFEGAKDPYTDKRLLDWIFKEIKI